MRRCFVFAAGKRCGLRQYPQEGDLVIAADAGYRYCQEEDIIPDLLIGDFDSMEIPEDFPNSEHRPHVERRPIEKDDTDTMLALKVGLSWHCDTFYIYGGLGGERLDHALANLQSLLYLRRRGAAGYLYEENFVWTVVENEALNIPRSVPDGLLSVFSLTERSEGVTLSGLRYPLSEGVLTAEFPLGVSNHFTAEKALIRVRKGALLVGWELPPVPDDEYADE